MKEVSHNNNSSNGIVSKIGFVLGFIMIAPIVVALVGLVFKGSIIEDILTYSIYGYVIYRLIKYFKKSKDRTKSTTTQESNKLHLNSSLTIENPYSGIFISGGAGSGKSKSIIEPLINDAGRNNFTGVVYDFKFPELAEYVNTAYESSTIARHFVNFTDVNTSSRINPISPELMKNDSYAREFAFSILANLNPEIIKKTDFWTDNSLALLSSVFWYLKTNHPKQCTLPHAISLILQPDLDLLLDKLESNSKCSDMIATILTAKKQGATNQLSGVISSLQVSLSKINTSEIYYILSESDFSLNLNDPINPTILTIGNDPSLANTYSPIIGLILTSLSKQLNQRDKEKSIFMLDEFPTVFVPNIEQLPATGRSNKIATILACQDIAQVVDRYGKSKADTILSNLGNQFFGRTTNPETAQRVSTMFGKSDKRIESFSTNYEKKIVHRNSGKSESYTFQERDLVKAQDVAQLQTGSFYTIVSEGNIRQGKTEVKVNPNFRKTPLKQVRELNEEHLEICFERIKSEAKDILLKYSV